MKISKPAFSSICLNLVLGITALTLGKPPSVRPALIKSTPVTTNKATRIKRIPGPATSPATNALVAAFHWRTIESDDYKKYVANLRAIGCSESTIRDIIEADLTDLYLRRRRELMEPLQKQFWDLAARGSDAMKEKFEKDLEKLEEETTGAIDEILGAEKESPPSMKDNYQQRIVSYLSEEKQQQLAELNERFLKLKQNIQAESASRSKLVIGEKLKEIDRQKQEAIKQLLAPGEYEEYQLRTSRFANVGENLYGFDATEEDLRAIAKVQLSFATADERVNPKEPDHQTKLARQQSLRDEQLRNLLGEERHTEFKRAQDGEFQQIYRVAERFDLSLETASQVDDIRKAALAQAQQVHKNQTVLAGQRAEILAAIQRETEKAINQTFGDQAAKTYRKNGGAWLENLAKP